MNKPALWDADLAFAGLRPDGVPANRADGKNLHDARSLRATVFKVMWNNSPRFREKLLGRLSVSVNHRLTRNWMEERVRHSAQLEKEAGLDCFNVPA